MVNREDIWTAIWTAENSTGKKTADFLRSLLPAPAPKSTKGKRKIAFIIGHNEKSPGAYAPHPINESEYVFNGKVADELVKIANNSSAVEIKVFRRKKLSRYSLEIDEVYGRVNAWNPDFSIEAHFNWLNKAGRVEMIHFPNSKIGKIGANILLRNFADELPHKGIKVLERGKNDRGGRSLWACKSPIVMTEPFDCTYTPHLLAIENLGHKGVAMEYYRSIIQTLEKI